MRTVAGLDVHKGSIFMCILNEQGGKIEKKFGVSTCEIKGLSAELKSHYASEICMESISIYWKPNKRGIHVVTKYPGHQRAN